MAWKQNNRTEGTGTHEARKGFTLIELLVVIAIIALLISLLLPALGKWKITGRMLVSSVNLRELGTAGASYSADYKDAIANFTWKQNVDNRDEGDTENLQGLDTMSSPLAASSAQATYIMRRRSGLGNTVQQPATWIPQILYTHLSLLDYRGASLPTKTVVNPEDTNRLNWQDLEGFRANRYAPNQPIYDAALTWRWSFSSSYQAVCPAFSPNLNPSPVGSTLYNTVSPRVDNLFTYEGPGAAVKLGDRKFSDATFPSQKVHWYDGIARHDKVKRYYADPAAKQPLGFFDSSVVVRSAQDANKGFFPNLPVNGGAPAIDVDDADFVNNMWDRPNVPNGRYLFRWQTTRNGLGGVDFNGTEVRAQGF